MGRKACNSSVEGADKSCIVQVNSSSNFQSWHIWCESTASVCTIMEMVSILGRWSPERFSLALLTGDLLEIPEAHFFWTR